MGLNIKNPETHRLAEELAKRIGESLTAAVTTAVRERLDRVRREQGASLANRLLEIGQDCAKRLKEPFRSADQDELLYDWSEILCIWFREALESALNSLNRRR